ncbi:hypothetical protein OG339_47835 (plasmid) [Streptosporangium sp. NBC_01495]|uniref:hypothetical protein n=1 Tax=Streptosporangium sp. NBC_01495 TaxID=2903899 RepID=UPI002E2ED181|nr:hypothetical protein [Streptosporangium sp. NBC_01495]
MRPRSLTFLPLDADAATVIAYLDDHPQWDRNPDRPLFREHYIVYTFIDPRDREPRSHSALVPAPNATPIDADEYQAKVLANAIRTVNAYELGFYRYRYRYRCESDDALSRLIAIALHHQAEHGSLQCRCGLPAPCPTLRLAVGQDVFE